MAKSAKKVSVSSYTINATNEIIRPGGCVLMRADDPNKLPFVARVEKFEVANEDDNNMMVCVRWYYRPEDTTGGRRLFHGVKELFLSDHRDVQSVRSILCKCNVHTFSSYNKLHEVGPEDFFSRFHYSVVQEVITPKSVTVYCKCDMPHNPDDLMVQCEGCEDWYHPSCVGLTNEDARNLDHFFCCDCDDDDDDDDDDEDEDDDDDDDDDNDDDDEEKEDEHDDDDPQRN